MSEHLRKNPFFVLELQPSATQIEVQRQGTKLLGMLELGLEGARAYASPFGTGERTQDDVRRAMAELRDPDKRALWELWARARTTGARGDDEPLAGRVEGVEGTLEAFGFRRC